MKTTIEFANCNKRPDLEECETNVKNIGWSLGNYCPYKCKQCYSLSVRDNGRNLTKEDVDIILKQIKKINCETLNFGGNEPWFTNGNTNESLLPYIIKEAKKIGLNVGVTTSGISLICIEKFCPDLFQYIDDVDISLDSPIEAEHNENRGSKLYPLAIEALKLCIKYQIPHSIVMCSMKWNFTEDRIKLLIDLCKKYDANIRFNFLKPVKKEHINEIIPAKQLYDVMSYVLQKTDIIDITEPRLSGITNNINSKRCPCGRTSLRIHSITPDGKIPVSPCVYMHDYKVGNLLEDDIADIISSEPFKEFRRRNKNPSEIKGCEKCKYLDLCGGGCASAAYLYNKYRNDKLDIYVREENCPKDLLNDKFMTSNNSYVKLNKNLVHMDYLCTFIGKIK